MIIKLDVGFGENEQIDGFFAFAFAIYEKKENKIKGCADMLCDDTFDGRFFCAVL